MTAVVFKFANPDGTPAANAPFRITTRKPSFDETLDAGIQLPGDIDAVTDAQGMATVTLMPGFAVYYLLLDRQDVSNDSDGCTAGLRYRFMVPESNIPLRVEDLIFTTPPFSRPWDETALQIIIEAKAVSQASAAAAKESEIAAEFALSQMGDNAERAEAAAAAALESKTQAGVSAAAAAASQASATASANTATGKAQEALQSAASALANKQITDANALASQGSAASAAADKASAAQSAATATQAAATTTADKAVTTANVAVSDGLKADTTSLRDEAKIARDEAVAAAGAATGAFVDGGLVDLSAGVYPAKPTVSTIWRVSVGGSVTSVPEGTIVYAAGDDLVYTKTNNVFYKTNNSNAVASVNTRTGAVVLTASDVNLGMVNNTPDSEKPVSVAQQTALNGKQDKHANLTALAAVTATADRVPMFSSPTAMSLLAAGTFGKSLLATATQIAARTALDLVPSVNTEDLNTGRLLRVGDYGFGTPITITDANVANTINGAIYKLASPFNNGPTAAAYIIQSFIYDAEVTQVAYVEGQLISVAYMRQYRGAWQAWVKVATSRMVGEDPAGYSGNIDDVTTIPYGFTAVTGTATGTKPPGKTYGFLQTFGQTLSASSAIRQIWNDYDGAVGTKTTWVRDKYGNNPFGNWRLIFDQNSVVGVVTNPSVVGSGSIMERGGNSSGDFIKFMDGTLIAWRTSQSSTANSYDLGSGWFGGDAIGGGTPTNFIAEPSVTCSVVGQAGVNTNVLVASCFQRPTASSFGSWRAITLTGTALNFAQTYLKLIATGRWY